MKPLKLSLAITLCLLFASACSEIGGKTGGSCEYLTVQEKGRVTAIDDQQIMIKLSDQTITTSLPSLDFSAEVDQSVLVRFKRITKGSCAPLVVTGITSLSN